MHTWLKQVSRINITRDTQDTQGEGLLQETKAIHRYFRHKIEAGKRITMEEGMKFVKENPSIKRDAKQIVDKVRNLAKDYSLLYYMYSAILTQTLLLVSYTYLCIFCYTNPNPYLLFLYLLVFLLYVTLLSLSLSLSLYCLLFYVVLVNPNPPYNCAIYDHL